MTRDLDDFIRVIHSAEEAEADIRVIVRNLLRSVVPGATQEEYGAAYREFMVLVSKELNVQALGSLDAPEFASRVLNFMSKLLGVFNNYYLRKNLRLAAVEEIARNLWVWLDVVVRLRQEIATKLDASGDMPIQVDLSAFVAAAPRGHRFS